MFFGTCDTCVHMCGVCACVCCVCEVCEVCECMCVCVCGGGGMWGGGGDIPKVCLNREMKVRNCSMTHWVHWLVFLYRSDKPTGQNK